MWWNKCVEEVRQQLQDTDTTTLEPYQEVTTREHLKKILSGENSGENFYQYYVRDKTAWLSVEDSSTGDEDVRQEESAAAGPAHTNTAGTCMCVCI